MSNRNSFLIDPKVQWTLIRRLMMHWCLMLLSLVSVGVLMQLYGGAGDGSFTTAMKRSFTSQGPLIILMFMLVPVYLHDVLRVSHRFAGPMLRLRKILKSLASGGNGAQLKFRPGDFWQETADDFNGFYTKHMELRKRCKCLEGHVRKLRSELKKARQVAQSAQTTSHLLAQQVASSGSAAAEAPFSGNTISAPEADFPPREGRAAAESGADSPQAETRRPQPEPPLTQRSAKLVDLEAFPILVEQSV